MGDRYKIENGRVLLDAPGPQRILNQGPDPLYVVDAALGGKPKVVAPDKDLTVKHGVFVSSTGRARIVVFDVDLEQARLEAIEQRLGALEDG